MRRARRTMTVLTLGALLPFAVLLASCGRPMAEDPAPDTARAHGIEILGVQLLAGGDLAKLSYRVVDIDRATAALKKPLSLAPEGDARALEVLSLGRLGPMRQRPSGGGSQQFVLFTNSSRALQKGGRAVLRIGTDRIEGIPVS